MASGDISSTGDNGTLYFGYGSNLWKTQMLKRCPSSVYQGIARLNGYRWIINDRGYANVVQTSNTASDEVWGLVYSLTPSDESKLDLNEGVPYAYTKENLLVDSWPFPTTSEDGKPDVGAAPERKEMLVYIDPVRTEADAPKREYVYRMNRGVADAVAEGVPEGYVRDVVRRFIPAEDRDGGDSGGGEVEVLARRQAERFVDEG